MPLPHLRDRYNLRPAQQFEDNTLARLSASLPPSSPSYHLPTQYIHLDCGPASLPPSLPPSLPHRHNVSPESVCCVGALHDSAELGVAHARLDARCAHRA